MKYTRGQLEAMSDLKINRIIAVIEGNTLDQSTSDQQDDGECSNCTYECHAVTENANDGYAMGFLDYCNNWLDMGPLIIEGQISLCNFITYYRANSLLTNVRDYIDHTSPLRAAAIVYILINH